MLLAVKWILMISTLVTVVGVAFAVRGFRVELKIAGGKVLAVLNRTREADEALERMLVEGLTGREDTSGNGLLWLSLFLSAFSFFGLTASELPMVLATGGWLAAHYIGASILAVISLGFMVWSAWRVYRIYIGNFVKSFADGHGLFAFGVFLTLLGAFGQFLGSLLDLAIEAKWLG